MLPVSISPDKTAVHYETQDTKHRILDEFSRFQIKRPLLAGRSGLFILSILL
jgi:hypothetical protein